MRIAIIGFGFSGLMSAANLIRNAAGDLTLYIIDAKMDGRGTAYSTTNPEHLLNVAASNMSAFAESPDHLVTWLATPDAAAAKAGLKLTKDYGPGNFIPRALYGAYLASIWRETQELASAKKLAIKLVPTNAVAVTKNEEIAVLTARGDAIAVDRIILAVGHEPKAIFPHIRSSAIVQDIWAQGALAGAANWASPVLMLGTGLTSIDMLLSLRRAGYAGQIIMTSRRGLLPQAHAPKTSIFSFNEAEIAALKTLPQMMRVLRRSIRQHGDWRAVFDALRPHTQTLWKKLTPREHALFFSRVLPQFSVHRHRMAPEIAAVVTAEITAAKTRILASRNLSVAIKDDRLQVNLNGESFTPSHILNCAGLELNLARSSNCLLKQLLADGMVEAHVSGLGVAADQKHRAWGVLYPDLTIIGSLLTGQLLESTAVPELRVQAARASGDGRTGIRPDC